MPSCPGGRWRSWRSWTRSRRRPLALRAGASRAGGASKRFRDAKTLPKGRFIRPEEMKSRGPRETVVSWGTSGIRTPSCPDGPWRSWRSWTRSKAPAACPASGSEPRRRRVQAFSRCENLAEGAIHSPRGNEIKGPPRNRGFVGNKRNKNAELSRRALEKLAELDTE